MRDLEDVVKVKKPTVEREGDVVERCFIYERMDKCFNERCFWRENGECPIAQSLNETGSGEAS
ncbi:MAG: hypothetical protein ABEJ72_04600 [Candidatus Aenigmatarchaeota archaeon]